MPALLIRTSEIAGGGADDLAPGLAKLAELRPKKLSYFWTAWAPLLESGDVHVAAEFDYYIEGMKDKGYSVGWNNPTDQGFATYQHLSIPAASENKDLAEAFLNAMLDPGVQTSIANKTYQGPTNSKVMLAPGGRQPLHLRRPAGQHPVLRRPRRRREAPGYQRDAEDPGAAGLGGVGQASCSSVRCERRVAGLLACRLRSFGRETAASMFG